MKINSIKEKAAQNPRKSNSEARISHNSGVENSPNSLERRERESWDGVLVVRGSRLSSGGRRPLYFRGSGAALSILLRKIQRKQEPMGLRDWCPGSNTPLGRANFSAGLPVLKIGRPKGMPCCNSSKLRILENFGFFILFRRPPQPAGNH